MTDWNYVDFRASLSPTKDKDLIDHLQSYFPADMSRGEIVRHIIRCHMKVIKTVGSPDNLDGKQLPGVQEIIGMLSRIQVVAATGGNVEEAIEEVKEGFDFGGDSFFEDNDE
jgi:hypothetical protein